MLAGARYLTFTACGSTIVHRDELPDGFFVSTLVHENDEACYPDGDRNATGDRRKLVRLLVTEHHADFSYAAAPVLLAVAFVLIGGMSFLLRSRYADWIVLSQLEAVKGAEASDAAEGVAGEWMVHEEDRPAATRGSLLSPASVLFTCALLIVAFGVNSVYMDLASERRSGNMDACYRNDLCSHDVGDLPDLNHVISNVPYVGAGVGFLLAVGAQRHVYAAASSGAASPRGVPHDFDLFASLGAALMLEGFTSGLYHVCPNSRNSDIDFFFIYYLYCALGAKVFQTRRGVTNRFHYTPALLVAAITLLGSLQYLAGRSYAWWVVVVLVHMTGSTLWAVQMYLRGDVGCFLPVCRRTTADQRTRRIAIVNLLMNLTLAIVGLVAPSAFSDFSMYALLFFTLNSGLYIAYYFGMKKLRYRESPSRLSVAFLLMGLAAVVPALVVFVFYNPYNTEESAALSRTANAHCVHFGFFDAHDVWHFLSATALFFLLMGILTLDDDLLATPRNKIPVF
ncbi:SID1 transmembrane family member 1-like [Pollicipes pollicipes]|uniref:SID1 transmembrane family member 1-like n=1 Tax=Pollicipes pollicipes TaxID=41117 RepID=UPI001884F630|nr:SID1 transmembrane family member 1-like [Pollicipes pollicipes]